MTRSAAARRRRRIRLRITALPNFFVTVKPTRTVCSPVFVVSPGSGGWRLAWSTRPGAAHFRQCRATRRKSERCRSRGSGPDMVFRQKDACDFCLGAGPAPYARLPSPCASESRGASCARVRSVEMSVSQPRLHQVQIAGRTPRCIAVSGRLSQCRPALPLHLGPPSRVCATVFTVR